jgi:hypothetical protein
MYPRSIASRMPASTKCVMTAEAVGPCVARRANRSSRRKVRTASVQLFLIVSAFSSDSSAIATEYSHPSRDSIWIPNRVLEPVDASRYDRVILMQPEKERASFDARQLPYKAGLGGVTTRAPAGAPLCSLSNRDGRCNRPFHQQRSKSLTR